MARKSQTENAEGTTAEPARPERKQRKSRPCLLERHTIVELVKGYPEGGGMPSTEKITMWVSLGGFQNADLAAKAITSDGEFRIITIKRSVTAKKQTVEKIVLT